MKQYAERYDMEFVDPISVPRFSCRFPLGRSTPSSVRLRNGGAFGFRAFPDYRSFTITCLLSHLISWPLIFEPTIQHCCPVLEMLYRRREAQSGTSVSRARSP